MANSSAAKKKNVVPFILPNGDEKESYTFSEIAEIVQMNTQSLQRYKGVLMQNGITFPESKGGGGSAGALRYTHEQKNMFTEVAGYVNEGLTLKYAAAKVVQNIHEQEKQQQEEKAKQEEKTAQAAPDIDRSPNVIKDEDKPLLKNIQSKFKFGDIMEGIVTSIESYGVFINDGPYVRGLLHISNIKDGIVTDPNKYFAVGQKVSAKVMNVKPDGKLSLSTRHLNKAELEEMRLTAVSVDPSSINTIDMPISTIKGLTDMKYQLMQQPAPAKEETKQMATTTLASPIMKDVQEVLKGKVGIISTAAEKKFTELFEKYGTVPFLMQLGVVSATFEMDLGLLLAKELEQKLQCL